MTRPAHTPYDGSATPFTIGLKPFDPGKWIELDGDLESYLAEKDRLFETVPERVFMARPDTVEAQREVLDAFVQYLPKHFPDHYRPAGNAMLVGESERRVILDADDPAPLKTASLLVPEDFVLMRKCDDGWRLVAASLCFPSSWSLADKFDRPMQAIHEPVPDFGPGTRMAVMIARIFDNLKVGVPVERMNWSVQENAELHHPRTKTQRDQGAEANGGSFLAGQDARDAFLRVERQTLTRMAVSGDILFTIRIHLDPISVLESHPNAAALARGLAAQLAALQPGQVDYKGLGASRERMMDYLLQLAERVPEALDG